MVNILKLKAVLVEKGKDVNFLADAMGTSKATVYRKFDSPDNFTVGDVDRISEALGLAADKVNAIFFNQFISSGKTA
jgi:hypothetical protein